jgi:RNA polymerase sigma factor (sigma-70 family)
VDTNDLSALAARAAAGDLPALDVLLRELGPRIVRTTRLIVGPGSSAGEDAAQDALLDVVRGIRSLRNPDSVAQWAVRLAVRRAVKVSRRERLRSVVRFDRALSVASAELELGSAAHLKKAFADLSPRLRAVAVLRLYLGMSEAETADLLSCSRGTVKSQLHDARVRLTEALRREGVGPRVQSSPSLTGGSTL